MIDPIALESQAALEAPGVVIHAWREPARWRRLARLLLRLRLPLARTQCGQRLGELPEGQWCAIDARVQVTCPSCALCARWPLFRDVADRLNTLSARVGARPHLRRRWWRVW